MLSELTVKALTTKRPLREVDRIRVKGKNQPVAIYESLEVLPEHRKEKIVELLPTFQEALVDYKSQSWLKAQNAFKSILEQDPEDSLAQIYLERCAYFIQTPPSEDWDGVWVMKTK